MRRRSVKATQIATDGNAFNGHFQRFFFPARATPHKERLRLRSAPPAGLHFRPRLGRSSGQPPRRPSAVVGDVAGFPYRVHAQLCLLFTIMVATILHQYCRIMRAKMARASATLLDTTPAY
ncbi:uncharacterized protein VTP21DRAFT_3438 [Calcarisporiella thermophila]|uniref:uncharacterized protein n=1 Tax=Calcarisporiella thermophila TaxID=911321 RepID=UPI0037420060